MAFQNLLLPIVSVFRSVGIQAARGALGGLSKDFDTFAKEAGKAGMAFAGMQAILSGTQFITQSVEMTQKFERNLLALEAVFESLTPKMEAFTRTSTQYGISQSQAAQASVFLGSVLKQYGLSISESASETQKLVLLSQDLATTYGYDLSEALVAVTALFRGEYDPIEKFGVAMKQSEINAYLAARGLDDLQGSALLLAQVQARLALLYERSTDAQGAFSRASDTLYASQQKLNAGLENLMVAFGTPLQKPLSEITDMFAELAKDLTPKLVAIADTLAESLTAVGPLFVSIVGLLGELLILLVPVIAVLGGLAAILNLVITPLAQFLSYLIDISGDAISGVIDDLADIHWGISDLVEDLSPEFLQAWNDFITGFDKIDDYENSTLNKLVDALVDLSYWITGNKRDTFEYTSENKRFELQAERSATALIGLKAAAEETAPALTYMQTELQSLGIYATSAEGNLIGLAGIFDDIDTAAKKSNAAEALDEIGFSAGQIETILTKPDWYQIFADISAAAAIASQDISTAVTSGNWDLVNQIMKAQGILDEALNEITDGSTGGGTPEKPRDAVKALFNQLREETNKQSASLKLASMGASEGLIQLILGDKDWSKLWNQIKTGAISLDELQRQFNSTAAGAAELAAAMQAAADAKEEMLAGLNDKLEEATQNLANAKQAAKDLQAALTSASTISILPTVADEIGQFQSQIQGIGSNVSGILRDALDNGSLLQANYDELVKFANEELAVLEANARQRDELYKRYSFTQNIIKEYRAALTGALSLTSLFNKLSKETEKRTVTEVNKGITSLGSSVKEFAVTISRSYEETIDKVTNKTGSLLDGFRQMAEKSRAFAKNLRTLKEMGLDPKLFSQLVDAGVEAGGETAQAIVDGGKAAVDELGAIYNEIDAIGGELGLDMAPTFYNAGDTLMESLMSGIRGQQTALENTARTLATAFSAAFQSRVAIAVQVPVTGAQTAATNAANAVNNVNTGAIERINAMILQATEYFTSSGLTEAQVAGAGQKIGAYNALLQDLISGQITDISAISAGMTSADLRTAALATGGTNVTNYYNVEVNASGYAGGVQAGQAVIEEIINFERNNGSSGRFLIQAQ